MSKRKGLGRGLDALLGGSNDTTSPAPTTPPVKPAAKQGEAVPESRVPIEALQRGRYQPRIDMRKESLDELASSIRAQGLIQPIVVRALPNAAAGQPAYEIIAGERRWRAAQIAGLGEVPVAIRNVDDEAAMAMALIENIQREDLNPLEEAEALRRLVAEFDLTHEETAKAVGRSRAAVSNLMRLPELAPDVQTMLRAREIEMGHARALLGISDPVAQLAMASRCRDQKLTVRALEAAIRADKKPAQPIPVSQDPNVRALETDLSEKLGAPVKVISGKGGSGKLTITYHSLDELDGILAHIK